MAVAGIVIIALSSTFIFQSFEHNRQTLVILNAGSLIVPLETVARGFKEKYPNVHIILEPYGSIDCARLLVEGNKTADLLAVADYNVITAYVFPSNLTDWYIIFATNEMVIAFTNQSKYSDEINSTNWFEILARTDVRFGHSDPNRDPAGYRTLLLWKLADIYYNADIYETLSQNSPRKIIRPKSVELLALLESHDIDYAFEYKSVAIQHNLSYIELPDEINLGNWNYTHIYSKVHIVLADGVNITAGPILYALTIPNNALHYNLSVEFVKFLISEEGMHLLQSANQLSVYPALTNKKSVLPQVLQPYVTEISF